MNQQLWLHQQQLSGSQYYLKNHQTFP